MNFEIGKSAYFWKYGVKIGYHEILLEDGKQIHIEIGIFPVAFKMDIRNDMYTSFTINIFKFYVSFHIGFDK
tara:strand:- start:4 stop:219 length:216 start_codon:yes stop_codon:yes gene_type:complete